MAKRVETGSAATKQDFKRFWQRKAKAWRVVSVETIKPARSTFPGTYRAVLVPR